MHSKIETTVLSEENAIYCTLREKMVSQENADLCTGGRKKEGNLCTFAGE